jgi:hypothetical protein
MLRIEKLCPFCCQGMIGFFAPDTGGVVLLCQECDLAYPRPDDIDSRSGFDINDWTADAAGSPHKHGHWASSQEIERAGWTSFVAGEVRDYREG